MKRKRFHQLVQLERGPVNTAIIDLLTGNIFQVENDLMDSLENEDVEPNPEFLTALEEAGLLFEIDENAWVPDLNYHYMNYDDMPIELEVEEGVDPRLVERKFRNLHISRLTWYGDTIPCLHLNVNEIIKKEKNFQECIELSRARMPFRKIRADQYGFNKRYNTCWGKKVAVAVNGDIKPCVYADTVVGNLENDNILDVLEKLKPYWEITKDKVEGCGDCELRYACFDCRVIAYRHSRNLHGPNPNCTIKETVNNNT